MDFQCCLLWFPRSISGLIGYFRLQYDDEMTWEHFFQISMWSKIRVCGWNYDNTYHTFGDSDHTVISGCWTSWKYWTRYGRFSQICNWKTTHISCVKIEAHYIGDYPNFLEPIFWLYFKYGAYLQSVTRLLQIGKCQKLQFFYIIKISLRISSQSNSYLLSSIKKRCCKLQSLSKSNVISMVYIVSQRGKSTTAVLTNILWRGAQPARPT